MKHFYLCLSRNALECHEANRSITDWSDLKKRFLDMFGKSKVDFDLEGESGKMLASEDPLSYVFHVISYLQATSRAASESDKVTRLFDGLPANLKSTFVRNSSTTVQEFTDRSETWHKKAHTLKKLFGKALFLPMWSQH